MSEFLPGTWLHEKLSAMGITEERYRSLKATVGLPPTCGCTARKMWLDKIWKEAFHTPPPPKLVKVRCKFGKRQHKKPSELLPR